MRIKKVDAKHIVYIRVIKTYLKRLTPRSLAIFLGVIRKRKTCAYDYIPNWVFSYIKSSQGKQPYYLDDIGKLVRAFEHMHKVYITWDLGVFVREALIHPEVMIRRVWRKYLCDGCDNLNTSDCPYEYPEKMLLPHATCKRYTNDFDRHNRLTAIQRLKERVEEFNGRKYFKRA